MNVHVRIVSGLWLLVGLALAAWSIWGLATQEHWPSVVASWLLVLGFAVLAIVAGAEFGYRRAMGRVLVRVVSGLSLIYALAWLLLGGIEDAASYAPGIALLVALSIYAFFAAKFSASAA
jgi:hypothetical protein